MCSILLEKARLEIFPRAAMYLNVSFLGVFKHDLKIVLADFKNNLTPTHKSRTSKNPFFTYNQFSRTITVLKKCILIARLSYNS